MRVWVVQKSEKFQVVTQAVGVRGGSEIHEGGVRRKSMSPNSPMTLMTLMTLNDSHDSDDSHDSHD